ncbi:MAG TPA: Hsp20/alpha crystallin family protein [Azospirillum sp.]
MPETTSGRTMPATRRTGDLFLDLREQMDRLFDNFFGTTVEPFGWGREGRMTMALRVDVSETPDAITIKADLPGLDEKDVELTLDGGVLTLKGEKKVEKEEKDEAKHYHVVERGYGSFLRTFRLPDTVEAEKVAATFDKGVLTITLPKTEEGKSRVRRIEIGGKPVSGEPTGGEVKH